MVLFVSARHKLSQMYRMLNLTTEVLLYKVKAVVDSCFCGICVNKAAAVVAIGKTKC